MLPKDYLVYILSGAFTSDPSDASRNAFYEGGLIGVGPKNA